MARWVSSFDAVTIKSPLAQRYELYACTSFLQVPKVIVWSPFIYKPLLYFSISSEFKYRERGCYLSTFSKPQLKKSGKTNAMRHFRGICNSDQKKTKKVLNILVTSVKGETCPVADVAGILGTSQPIEKPKSCHSSHIILTRQGAGLQPVGRLCAAAPASSTSSCSGPQV